jgi:hypothetical protein
VNTTDIGDINRILRKHVGVDASGNPTYKYGASKNHYGQTDSKAAVIPFKEKTE